MEHIKMKPIIQYGQLVYADDEAGRAALLAIMQQSLNNNHLSGWASQNINATEY